MLSRAKGTIHQGMEHVTNGEPAVPSDKKATDTKKERIANNTPAQPALKSVDASRMELQIALETAKLAEQRGMDQDAIRAYQTVRRLDPDRPGVAHRLAVLYDRLAMTDAAQREYTSALAESPHDPDLLCDHGYFQYSMGSLDEAEQTLRSCLKVDAGHDKAMVNLAVVLAEQQQFDEAQRLFETAIGPAAAMHNIGVLKLRQGHVEEGRQLIAEAVKRDPSIQQGQMVLSHVAANQQTMQAIRTVDFQNEKVSP
ncbi:MAG: tetratricopeptide repeat protein [Rhodopirellula sp. JB053]